MEDNRQKQKEKQLQDKFNNFLKDNKTCEGDECFIKDPQEIVQREHKKIITND